ncbi:MalY/PatB family protein [Vibrio sp. TH_r3]|uniref:MalY/PatB family protein n=1 Tax=Vibrio sp. TH_r3 TaxID=3082084 RepID=UPI002952DABA|nr:MalY/PatB family protein [Vibrio sp. TH_r3]MDV7103563.1 MalY/PatB family protein [Vibrio sp. TH_r3]
MTKIDLDKDVDRTGSNSLKWEFMTKISPHANEDTLPLWVADMDFPCAPEIIDAMNSRVNQQIFGYSMADSEYYESVQSWFQSRFNWFVDTDDIVTTSGVIPALESLISIFSQPNEGVIIQPPVYHMFATVINRTGRVVVDNPLINKQGIYSIDFDDLERKAKVASNKVMLFCSPHNPTGTVWSPEDLIKVANICLENDVLLVSDEIHFDLVRKGVTHYPLASLLPNEDKIITCTAPSKTFNLAGLHISNIVIQNQHFKQKWNEKVGLSLPSPIAISAVKAAYAYGEPWLEQVIDYIDNNFHCAKRYLEKNLPKAQFIVPDGTYFIWLDLTAYGLTPAKIDDLMIKKANVLLEGGTMFGREGKGYQRINIACHRAIVMQALERICSAFNE